jgi:hypothetical protein
MTAQTRIKPSYATAAKAKAIRARAEVAGLDVAALKFCPDGSVIAYDLRAAKAATEQGDSFDEWENRL